MDADDTPRFIYGTAWKEEETRPLTTLALEAGFRAFDTANQRKHYHEAGVGEALAAAYDAGLVQREELFIQTKFTYEAGQDHRLPYDPDASFTSQVEQSFASSLEHLNTTYLDSYLLHGPSTHVGLSEADREVWQAMEALVTSEKANAIGVSNVTADQLEVLLELADIPPSFVQNRCFARTGWDHDVRRVCASNGIIYQGFSLLTANLRELRSDVVTAIARRHEMTVPQVVFRFASQIGILPLTGTTDEVHMRQDLQSFQFRLTDDEIQALERIAV
jgi:diketogulonate reductase-like aldo/keto reductase